MSQSINVSFTPNRVKEVYRLEEMEKIFVRYDLIDHQHDL